MQSAQGPAWTAPFLFGKTPAFGDFVRVGSPGPAGIALEHWVDQGVATAEGRRMAAWPSVYAAGATHAFVFRPSRRGTREWLLGVIRPSFDAVGRRFPLMAYVSALPGADIRAPHLLPLAFGEFYDLAAAALADSLATTHPAELRARIGALQTPSLQRVEPAAGDYEAWAARAPLNDVWRIVFGPAAHPEHALRVVHFMAEAVAPFRGEGSPSTRLGLRLPLGAGGVAAAAFWLDALRRLAGAPLEIRTCFWCFDGTSGSLLVQLGETPASALADLWAPDPSSDSLCDLVEPSIVHAARLASRAPERVAEAIYSPLTLVRDFLDRL